MTTTAPAADVAIAAGRQGPPKPKAPVLSISDYVKSNHNAISAALPNIGLTAEAVARTALSQIYRNPQLAQCDHVSIMRAIIEAASLGLSFALGRAYLVPFNNKIKGVNGKPDSWRMEAQFMPGYQGLVDLVRRSSNVRTVVAEAVYAGDKFVFKRGLETDEFVHESLTEPDDAKLTHAYCLIRFIDGGYQLAVLTRQQIDKVRARSKSKDNGPWVTDYARMAIKTVVKLTTKLCPASIELSRAIELDNDAEMGQRQQLTAGDAFGPADPNQITDGSIDVEQEKPATQKVSDAAANLLKSVKQESPTTAEAGGEFTPPNPPQPAEKTHQRGQPRKCKSPFDCDTKLTTADEKELNMCAACQTKMTDRIREKNGTAVQPATPLVPPEDLDKEAHVQKLVALAGKARDFYLAENDGNLERAEAALSTISAGQCRHFAALSNFMHENPSFQKVIEEAIS